jgi:PAS domain S-box-containing protein
MHEELFDPRTFGSAEEVVEFVGNVLESSTEYSIVATDPVGLILLWNEGAQRLYGYTPAEVIGRSWDLLHTEQDVQRGLPHEMMQSALDQGKWEGTVTRVRKDGSHFTARVVTTPRRRPGGERAGFLLMSSDVSEKARLATAARSDVSERKHVERDLGEANAQLESASRAKDRFLASISHELRTPLNAILGFTGTLLMGLPGPLNDEQSTQLRTVQRSGRHLLSLINDLLDLARIESGKMELKIEPIACRDLLEEVAVGLRPLAEEKGIALQVLAAEDGVELSSDRRALSQILINLANNAIKFTDQGSVRLELSRQHDNGASVTRFGVTDTGCGIKAEDRERLFAAFEQIGGPDARPYEGTGLGLYICQTLAPLIGGAITFESVLGAGSTFALEVWEPVP